MSEIINSGRVYIANKVLALDPVEITHFVLANIIGLDHTAPVDLDEVMPDVGDIVATLPVTQTGYVSAAQVVYSLIMNSSVGPFEFNWIGLVSATGELIAVQYSPLVYKLKTAGGIIGNNMTRNFLVSFTNAQSVTEIVVPAETWQINNLIEADITVTVGAGGDFSTINEAIEYLSRRTPIYKNTSIRATIHLLTGFVMAEQVIVDGINLGWMEITAADAITQVTMTAITITTEYDRGVFVAINSGVMPIIKAVFALDTKVGSPGIHGFLAIGSGSIIKTRGTAGFKNASACNALAIWGGAINLQQITGGVNAVMSGASDTSLKATYGGEINATYADLTGSTYGAWASAGGRIHALSADASSSSVYGFMVSSCGYISAKGTTGTLNQTANIQTAEGLILK